MQGEMLMTQTKRDPGPLEASLNASLAYIESLQRTTPDPQVEVSS
jgi:hypothetical protein